MTTTWHRSILILPMLRLVSIICLLFIAMLGVGSATNAPVIQIQDDLVESGAQVVRAAVNTVCEGPFISEPLCSEANYDLGHSPNAAGPQCICLFPLCDCPSRRVASSESQLQEDPELKGRTNVLRRWHRSLAHRKQARNVA